MSAPTLGRIVHYLLPSEFGHEAWRPAIVVNGPWDGRVNLSVMLDGANDLGSSEKVEALNQVGTLTGPGPVLSVGSAREGVEPGCWCWPPRV